METYTADDRRPLDKCLADVRSCDLYIGILAWRYGFVPDGHTASITELEYRAAGEVGIPRLMFVLNEKAPWSPAHMDFADSNKRISAFRAAAREAHVCDTFASRLELRAKVAEALVQHLNGDDITPSGTVQTAAWDDYCRRLVQEYRGLDLDALTPTDRDEHLQIALRDVFVEPDLREDAPLVELPKELRRKLEHAAEQDRPEMASEIDRRLVSQARESLRANPVRAAFEVLATPINRTCVVLGDPGAGKSTLGRFLVLALADGTATGALEPLRGWRPVLVELRDYALQAVNYEAFPEYLDHRKRLDGLGVDQEAAVSYLRVDGRALVIFDGLDEIFDPRLRESVARRIVGFSVQYPKVKIIVTSRAIGYRPRVLREGGFLHFTVQELSKPKIDSFLSSWYSIAMPGRSNAAHLRRERLIHAIDDSAPIRELAGNPLLLTILAIIGKHQELPRERWKVYDHAASVLVQHWDVNKHLDDERIDADLIREDDKKELLRRLAIRMQEGTHGAAGNHLTEADLRAEIQQYLQERFEYDTPTASRITTVMVERLRERNFILARYGPGVYGFVHRAMLDYFTAAEIVNRFEKSRVLTQPNLQSKVFDARKEDPSWVEVLRLIAGMVDASVAGGVLDSLLMAPRSLRSSALDPKPPAVVGLAARCVAEIRNVNAARGPAARTIEAVIELLRLPARSFGDDTRANILEKAVLPAFQAVPAWPGRELFLSWFKEIGRSQFWEPTSILGPQLLAALFARDETVRRLLGELTTSASASQREGALRGLRLSWKEHPDTMEAVERLSRDGSSSVRTTALTLLTENWTAAAITASAIERAMIDHEPSLRAAGITALAQHTTVEPTTHQRILRAARNDPANTVRSGAVAALATHWPGDPATLQCLLEAGHDPWWVVRRDALRAVCQRHGTDPRAYELATHLARDADEDVREAAIGLLASRWTDDPGVVRLVTAAAQDTDADVRKAALAAMAARWPEEPTTALALDRLAHDHVGRVRVAALMWQSDPANRPDDYARALQAAATNDVNPDVRRAALERLLEDTPAAGAEAAAAALRDPDSGVRCAALRLLSYDVPYLSRLQPVILRLCSDVDRDVRRQAVETAARFWGAASPMPEILQRQTRSDDWRDRRSGLEALAALRPDSPETRDAVKAGMWDGSGEVRETAMHIASALGLIEEEALVARLFDPRYDCRTSAAVLASMRPHPLPYPAEESGALRAVRLMLRHLRTPDDPGITAATEDRDADVRYMAFSLLFAFRTATTVQRYAIGASRDSDGDIRRYGLNHLLVNQPGHPETRAARRRGLQDSMSDIRQMSLILLILESPGAASEQETMAVAMRDTVYSVRQVALDTVACRASAEQPIPAGVSMALIHSDPDVRTHAATMLRGALPHHPATIKAIHGCLRDVDPDVREMALTVVTLAGPDDPLTVEALHRGLTDESFVAASTAYRMSLASDDLAAQSSLRHPQEARRHAALTRLLLEAPRDGLFPDIWTALTDASNAVRSLAGSRILLAPDLPDLRDRLSDLAARHPDGNVRWTALGLVAMRWPASAETHGALVHGLQDQDVDVRRLALAVLHMLHPRDAGTLTAIVDALGEPASPIRELAVRLLTAHRMENPVAFDALIRACGDLDDAVREAAQLSLLVVRPVHPATVAVLARGLADLDATVRETAAAALDRLPAEVAATAEESLSEDIRRRIGRYRVLEPSGAGVGEPARQTIAELCADEDWDVRQAAVLHLALRWPLHIDTQSALDRAIADQETYVRWRGRLEAVRRAAGMDRLKRVAFLGLQDSDAFRRAESLRYTAVWEWDDHERELVIRAAKDDHPYVRLMVSRILSARLRADGVDDPVQAAGGCSPWSYLGDFAIRLAVRKWGDRPAGRDDLIAGDARGDVAATILLAARWADDPEVAETMRRHQQSDHHAIRMTGLHGLARCWLDDPATRVLLNAGTQDPCPGVRSVALNALVQIGGPDVQKFVSAAMNDADGYVSIQAFGIMTVRNPSSETASRMLDQLAAPAPVDKAFRVFEMATSRMHIFPADRSEVLRRLSADRFTDGRIRRWLESAARGEG